MANQSPSQALILIVIINYNKMWSFLLQASENSSHWHSPAFTILGANLFHKSHFLLSHKTKRAIVLGIFYQHCKSAEVLLKLIRYFPLNGNMGNGSNAWPEKIWPWTQQLWTDNGRQRCWAASGVLNEVKSFNSLLRLVTRLVLFLFSDFIFENGPRGCLNNQK